MLVQLAACTLNIFFVVFNGDEFTAADRFQRISQHQRRCPAAQFEDAGWLTASDLLGQQQAEIGRNGPQSHWWQRITQLQRSLQRHQCFDLAVMLVVLDLQALVDVHQCGDENVAQGEKCNRQPNDPHKQHGQSRQPTDKQPLVQGLLAESLKFGVLRL